jgi:hypothetical protein
MKPTYQVRVWQEDGWWLARVIAASDGADPAPLNALTQARGVAKIESMGRDLIATILDASEDAYDVEFEYQLSGESGELVCQAKGARAWLDAAQDLWQERSAAAVKALTAEGYSLRETATLLGLSHQRVDQILGHHFDRKPSNLVVFCEGHSDAALLRRALPTVTGREPGPLIVAVGGLSSFWLISASYRMDTEVASKLRALLREAATVADEHTSVGELEDHSSAHRRK